MKLRHKVMPSRTGMRSDPVSDRYETEVAESVRKAEKAWRNAQRQAERAERKHRRQPSPTNTSALERACCEAERLWLEFETLDRLVRQGPVTGVNRTGRGSVRRVGPAGSGDSRGR